MKARITSGIIALLLLLTLILGCSPNKKESESEIESKDAQFLINTASTNYAEINLAELANTRSEDPEVKRIAKVLENDHSKTLTEVKNHANRKGVILPSGETEEDTQELADLIEKENKEFDKMWCKKLVDNHKKTIRNFEHQMSETSDPELQKWISSRLPTLKGHLEMLKNHENRSSL